MSFHDNILNRKGRPTASASANARQQIVDDIQRAKACHIALPLPLLATASHAPYGAGGEGRGHAGQDIAAAITVAAKPPFSVRTLADRWDCSEGVVRSLIRNGQLGHFRVGDLYRIPAEEVGRFECR